MFYIEKYNLIVADIFSKRIRRFTIAEDSAIKVHKKALQTVNHLREEILKITNFYGDTVFTVAAGFTE